MRIEEATFILKAPIMQRVAPTPETPTTKRSGRQDAAVTRTRRREALQAAERRQPSEPVAVARPAGAPAGDPAGAPAGDAGEPAGRRGQVAERALIALEAL